MKKIILLLTPLLIFLACSPSTEKFKIGIIAPLTGEGATYGEAMKRGFDLAFQGDSLFSLVYEDTKLQANEGVNAAQKLISSDRVSVIYGAAASSVTLAVAPVAERNGVILFSSISTADDIKSSGDFIFRNVPANGVQGKTAAEFLLNSLSIDQVGILSENDDYGESLASSFKAEVLKNSGTILVEETYLSTDTDFRTQLTKAKNSGAEALFIPGNYEESALIIKQARELGINIPIIGGDGSYSPDLINLAGIAAEGFYCTIMAVDEESDLYKKFSENFQKKYNSEPNVYEAYAYEAGIILKEAIINSGYSSENIKNYLYSTSFNSLTGDLTFDNDGEVDRLFGVVKVDQEMFTKVQF